jgi:hypothetical protein
MLLVPASQSSSLFKWCKGIAWDVYIMDQMQFIANLLLSFVFLLVLDLWIFWSAQSQVLTFFREFFQQSIHLFNNHVFTTHISVLFIWILRCSFSQSGGCILSMLLTVNETECPSTKNVLQKICNRYGKISLKCTFVKTALMGCTGSDGSKDRKLF